MTDVSLHKTRRGSEPSCRSICQGRVPHKLAVPAVQLRLSNTACYVIAFAALFLRIRDYMMCGISAHMACAHLFRLQERLLTATAAVVAPVVVCRAAGAFDKLYVGHSYCLALVHTCFLALRVQLQDRGHQINSSSSMDLSSLPQEVTAAILSHIPVVVSGHGHVLASGLAAKGGSERSLTSPWKGGVLQWCLYGDTLTPPLAAWAKPAQVSCCRCCRCRCRCCSQERLSSCALVSNSWASAAAAASSTLVVHLCSQEQADSLCAWLARHASSIQHLELATDPSLYMRQLMARREAVHMAIRAAGEGATAIPFPRVGGC